MRPMCQFIGSSSVPETWCGSTQAPFTGSRPLVGVIILRGMSDHSQVRDGKKWDTMETRDAVCHLGAGSTDRNEVSFLIFVLSLSVQACSGAL